MMEKETKIKRITIKRERNEGDPCGIDGDYFSEKNERKWLRYKVCWVLSGVGECGLGGVCVVR